MTERRLLPLDVQIGIVERKIVDGNIPLNGKQLYEILADQQRAQRGKTSSGCPVRSHEVTDNPMGMVDGLNRLYELQNWIKAGRTVEEFYENFGSPQAGPVSDSSNP